MKNKWLVKTLALVITVLFVVTVLSPIVFCNNAIVDEKEILLENYSDNRYFYPDYYNCYNASEIIGNSLIPDFKYNNFIYNETEYVNILKETSKPLDGPMDSAWPMFNHDVHHTGRSPYSTINVTGLEKWRSVNIQQGWGSVEGGPIIDKDGIIYYGDMDHYLYALYPNGTRKWATKLDDNIRCTPAIDENGILYIGTVWGTPNYFYAIYSENGTIKWKFGETDNVDSRPAIGDDGTIYFGEWNGYINALYPNGTAKWRYLAEGAVLSSPAIGDDGTIYCGCHVGPPYSGRLYALYPNGTLKWKYTTGHWVRVSPCIGDDGTVYFVSLDGYLYAVYPENGTLKWKTDVGAGTHPSIDKNGIIYAGWENLYAIFSENGSIKWVFNPGYMRCIEGGSPITSSDGTIYFGTRIRETAGGEIIALDSNGTEKWRKRICDEWIDSSLAIGEDGTVYIGSSSEGRGYLHAFGPVESNSPPNAPIISGSTNVNVGDELWYAFTAIDPDNNPIQLFVDWGDGTSGWVGEYASGEKIWVEHAWNNAGTYIVKAKVKDVLGEESDFGYLEVKVIVPPVYKKALIYGRISNLTIEDTIMFEAVHINVINFLPFSKNLFKSGEKFTLTKNYKGFIGHRFIFSFCTMIT